MKRQVFILMLIVSSVLPSLSQAETNVVASTTLRDYVQQPDTSYSWKLRREGKVGIGDYVELTLTSQTWRDVPWKHQLYILRPSTLRKDGQQAILFISGGSWKPEHEQPTTDTRLPGEANLFAALAEHLHCPIAVLMQVPHQPLFDGKREDEIIAYTFDRFYQTGDDQWPLLLPMVKSAVRGMDAVQEYTKKEWELDIKNFTVSGASKRGWTTWLSGAVDPRANAIAPMVIDTLNMRVQMRHQKATWGGYSEQIADYTSLGLMERMESEEGLKLEAIVDPYAYRAQLLQPKLLILGTNDRYWTLDALNNYWNELEGPKYILYVPNNGHGLKDYPRITSSLAALHDHVASGEPLPQLTWNFQESAEKNRSTLEFKTDLPPTLVSAWVAKSASKDFRDAAWSSTPMREANGAYSYELEIPKEGYIAMFGEAHYKGRSLPYSLSTNVKILGGK